MGWTSPRKASEDAKKVAEGMAKDYEKQLKRSLTGDELRQVHEQARKSVSKWAKNTRR